ncbi:C40 family peptidase [Candidatus Wolfebacteria bacterium]|nr:C40 family peptidase [Candidatus Wolfebacteria bacterium]
MDKQTELVKIAKSFIGTPYRRGADFSGKPNFFDCSSFVQYVFKQIGIELPRSSILQAALGKEISILQDNNFENLEIGDLLFMRSNQGYYNDEAFNNRKIYIGHVAIYMGNENIIHSRKKLNGVIEQNIKELIKEPNYEIVLIKRFL